LSLAGRIAWRDNGIRLDRCIHQVAQSCHRQARLLELLPQSDQAQHQLRQLAGEHLERNPYADREGTVVHDGVGTDGQDQQFGIASQALQGASHALSPRQA
jgi:hypothetical protein